MTVSASIDIQLRPYAGYVDPGLPLGTYMAFTALTGDASGGLRTIIVFFKRANTPLSGNMFSFEQLSCTDTDLTSKTCVWHAENMDPLHVGPIDIGIRTGGTFVIFGITGGETARPTASGIDGYRGMWLGRALNAVNTAELRVDVSNVNLALLEFGMQGYYWGPRSITAPGGPRRPAEGLYRN